MANCNLEAQALGMTKAGTINTVKVRVPDVDRGRCDSRNRPVASLNNYGGGGGGGGNIRPTGKTWGFTLC